MRVLRALKSFLSGGNTSTGCPQRRFCGVDGGKGHLLSFLARNPSGPQTVAICIGIATAAFAVMMALAPRAESQTATESANIIAGTQGLTMTDAMRIAARQKLIDAANK